MELIHYSGDELLTGSAIAEALVRYAEALAKQRSAAAIEIPIRLENGTDSTASLLLGPASQLAMTQTAGPGEELVDEALVEDIERRISELALTPRLSDDGSNAASDWTDDL
jgi:hypothetical protein